MSLRHALLPAACALLYACALVPLNYSGAAISGRVVDAKSGTPIEGAVVLATWKISDCCATLQGPPRQRVIAVSETLTDARGDYRIPAWGPVDRPLGYERVAGFDPMVSVFKPRYEPAPLLNLDWQSGAAGARINGARESTLRSAYDGKEVRLVPYGEAAVPRLRNFAAVLEGNAIEADQDTRLASGNAIRQRVMSMQRRAVGMVDAELRRLGQSYDWSTPVTFLPGR